MSGLDFSFLAPQGEEPEGGAPATATVDPNETVGVIDNPETVSNTLDDIGSIFMPKDEAPEPAAKKTEPKPEPKTEPTVSTKQPIIHNDKLLALADVNGIGPDEAAAYPTGRALLAEIRLREMERNLVRPERGVQSKERNTPGEVSPGPQDDDIPFPEIKLDEDVDPSIKLVAERLGDYARKVKEYADRKISKADERVEAIEAGQAEIAEANARQAEARIADLFDEKVTSWGDEFKELIGVPQETWQKPGTEQHRELVKLRNYVLRSKAGYETMEGKPAGLEELAVFLEEARYALWPQKVTQSAQSDIAKKLKNQKGGVGLRPTRNSRETTKPEQGDAAARAAIASTLTSLGLNPYAQSGA